MKLVHLSDLHFGTETPEISEQLRQTLAQINPDHIIVSGDFTQVASSEEFKTAKAYIDSLPAPVFCVPGNHDIPPFKLLERFFSPYKKYKHYINQDLCPVFETDTIIIAGLNSARRALPHWNWANGAISGEQLNALKSVYKNSANKRRICVFHHPIHQALNAPMNTIVFGAKKALQILNELKVDLVLTGHVHHASITTIGDIDHKTTYVSASTALSSRLRKQENGFNLIHISDDALEIQIFTHKSGTFKAQENYRQKLTDK